MPNIAELTLITAVRHIPLMAHPHATSNHTITPKDLVEGFLRAANPEPLTIKSLLAVGDSLGFSHNAMRVAISRLCTKGLVISDARSCYRLTDKTDAVTAFTERWRLGEAQVRPWNGHWLCCHLPQGMGRTERNQSQKALAWYGFKLGLSGLYVRPDNLTLPIESLNQQLIDIALTPDATLFSAYHFSETQTQQWHRLWEVKSIEKAYTRHLKIITKSADKFFDKPLAQSLKESLLLGGETLRLLSLDPLLPSNMIDTASREALFDLMKAYETQCRTLWTDVIANIEQ